MAAENVFAYKVSCAQDDYTRCSLTLASISSEEDNAEETSKSSERALNAYEKWLLDKEKTRRAILLSKNSVKQGQQSEELRLKAEKEEKLKNSRIKYQVRLDKKDRTEQEEYAKRKEHLIIKEQDRIMKQRETEKKCCESFRVWIRKKNEHKIEMLHKLNDLAIVQDQDNAAKRLQNKDAFQKWCCDAANRPKPSHRSYGYSDGFLIGYYDSSKSAHPAYVNPRPWEHP